MTTEQWTVTVSKEQNGYRVYSNNNCGYSTRSDLFGLEYARFLASKMGKNIPGSPRKYVERI